MVAVVALVALVALVRVVAVLPVVHLWSRLKSSSVLLTLSENRFPLFSFVGSYKFTRRKDVS